MANRNNKRMIDQERIGRLVSSLQCYELVDVMVALAEQRGGTTPLYEAVEEATEEIDDNGCA